MNSEQDSTRTYRMPYPDRYVPFVAILGALVGAGTFWYWGPAVLWPIGFIFGIALTPPLLGLILGGPTDE